MKNHGGGFITKYMNMTLNLNLNDEDLRTTFNSVYY